jgi:probable rRNA maturation factor
MTVLIENKQNSILVDHTIMTIAEKVVDTAFNREHFPYGYEVGVTLVDNETIAALNREYRNIDAPTDVLSFAMLEGDEVIDLNEDGEAIMGDIIVSMPRAVEQAGEYGHSVEREFAYLLLHGVLHLLGYTHEDAGNARKMRNREEDILHDLDLTRD